MGEGETTLPPGGEEGRNKIKDCRSTKGVCLFGNAVGRLESSPAELY